MAVDGIALVTAAAELNRWLDEVAGGGLKAREEAISRLMDVPHDDLVGFLVTAVKARDFARRNAAIEVLGRMGPVALPALERRFRELSDQDRMFLTPVLAGYNDPRVLPALHAWARADDANLSATVCEALGRLRAPESVPVLHELVHRDPWLAGPAIAALGNIGHADALDVLMPALDDEELRPFAIEALGHLGMARAWPAVAAAVAADPTLVGVALDHLGPMLRSLGGETIRRAAQPKAVWVTAAHAALNRFEARYAAVRVLGAFRDAAAVKPLIDLYLSRAEEEAIPAELRRFAGAATELRRRLGEQLSDEEARRMVRLLFTVIPDAEVEALYFLTHPSPAVRLEIVMHLGGANGRRFVGPLTGLLAEPDALVRRAAMQILAGLWTDADVARVVADLVDLESLAPEMLEWLAREAPDPLPARIAAHLAKLGARRRTEEHNLLLFLEARRDPQHAVARFREAARGQAIELAQVPVIAAIGGSEVAELLTDLALRGAEAVRYAAAEALAAHPDATAAHIERLLTLPADAAVTAVAAGWVQRHPVAAKKLAPVLRQLPGDLPPVAEREVLRALRAAAPAAAAERFRRALTSGVWFLEVEAVRGLRAARVPDAAGLRTERLDPLAQEVLGALP